MESSQYKSIFSNITVEEGMGRALDMYIRLIFGMNRMVESGNLTKEQVDDLMTEVREYVFKLPQ